MALFRVCRGERGEVMATEGALATWGKECPPPPLGLVVCFVCHEPRLRDSEGARTPVATLRDYTHASRMAWNISSVRTWTTYGSWRPFVR